MPKWLVARLILLVRGVSYHHPILVHMQDKVQALYAVFNYFHHVLFAVSSFRWLRAWTISRPPTSCSACCRLAFRRSSKPGPHNLSPAAPSSVRAQIVWRIRRGMSSGRARQEHRYFHCTWSVSGPPNVTRGQAPPRMRRLRFRRKWGFKRVLDRYWGLCKSGVTGTEERLLCVCYAVTDEPTS